ncbi:MAG: hypothetical protein B0D92_03735 [Spirochaeta sp. LUC14_002_19_P3]|nr:MAG: hypothetical protein B0D92_03735 [Spirochaeta sp. LUC14_002_19_P3]
MSILLRNSRFESVHRRLDRQNLLIALLSALVLHIFIFSCFWLADLWRVKEFGEWAGPVQVKIGLPDAPETTAPELPEALAKSSASDGIAVPQPLKQPPRQAATVPRASAAKPVRPGANSGHSAMSGAAAPETSTANVPAQVRGRESGNSYVMEFDGAESDIGRAGAYEYILSYMPLPERISAASFDNIGNYFNMDEGSIRREIERHWELFRGEYIRRAGEQGNIGFADRPYYWSLLLNALNYDLNDAEWKRNRIRPIEIEFKVQPSDGPRGAELSDFKVISPSYNPQIDEAVLYGLSRWVYYNKSERALRGRITYTFQ